MTTIKYRVWNKYRFLNDDEFAILPDGKTIVYDYESGKWRPANHLDVDIQLYTGLKDENDVEIYDGDILRLPNDKKRIVFKVPGGFAIEALDWDYGKYSTKQYVPIEGLSDEQNASFIRQCLIVGNIYENYELLEVRE